MYVAESLSDGLFEIESIIGNPNNESLEIIVLLRESESAGLTGVESVPTCAKINFTNNN